MSISAEARDIAAQIVFENYISMISPTPAVRLNRRNKRPVVNLAHVKSATSPPPPPAKVSAEARAIAAQIVFQNVMTVSDIFKISPPTRKRPVLNLGHVKADTILRDLGIQPKGMN